MKGRGLMAWRVMPGIVAAVLAVPAGAQSVLDAGALKPGVAATGLKAAATDLEIGYSDETLSNNLPDWTSTYLLAAHRFGERKTLYGGLRQTRRFGLDDTEAHAGLYYPVSATWTSLIEASTSPTHEVLARYSVYGGLQKNLGDGWGLGFGLRHNEYSLVGTNVLSASAERYWGNFRGAYTVYSGRPEGASSAASHRFQLSYYYADRNFVGLSYSNGREVEYLGPSRGVLTSDVQNWTLSGQHWLAPAWALTYDVVNHEQGNLYRRQGLRLGIRHRF